MPNDSAKRRLNRWVMQSGARDLLPAERVSICLRLVVPSKKPTVMHSPSVMKAHYKNLCVCGSVWSCPVCASKISERRRVELSQGITKNPDLQTALVTLTLRHNRADDLVVVLDALLSAYRYIKSGRRWKQFVGDVGLIGSIRGLEVTYGVNGWHPHLHILTFQDGGSPDDLEGFFTERWLAALSREGREALSGPGIDVRTAVSDIADYIAKYGREPIQSSDWTMEHEITKSPVKKSQRGGLSPSQLLANYSFQNDRKAGWRWREYALTFKGKRQLVWSRGLRDRLGLNKELTDKELAKRNEQDAVILIALTLEQWRVVLANDARGELLEIAHAGDVRLVESFLASLGVGLTDQAIVESAIDTSEDFANEYRARADCKRLGWVATG